MVTASEIAACVGGRLQGPDRLVIGVCTLSRPKAGALGFSKTLMRAATWQEALSGTVLLIPEGSDDSLPGTHVVVARPRAAFQAAVERFFVAIAEPLIAATAAIHPTALIDETASVGDFCTIARDVEIGAHTIVHPHVSIGPGVKIGRHCVIKPTCVIGYDGYAIEKNAEGNNARIPHLGSVIIHDYVDVGSFTTVCAGTIDPTEICNYAKIDDHVHIAHNCHIGENCIVIACAEVSGSVRLGRGAWLAPNCSIINGVQIGEGAIVGIGAVVTRNCDAHGVYVGSPARKIKSTQPETAVEI